MLGKKDRFIQAEMDCWDSIYGAARGPTSKRMEILVRDFEAAGLPPVMMRIGDQMLPYERASFTKAIRKDLPYDPLNDFAPISLLAIVPVVVLGAWISEWFIPLIDGGKYVGTVSVFRVLSIATVIGLACSPHVHLLFRYGEFGFLLAVAGAILGVSIPLNAVLISRYHALGAAIGLCLATGAMNLLVYARARMLLASRPVPPHVVAGGAEVAAQQPPESPRRIVLRNSGVRCRSRNP